MAEPENAKEMRRLKIARILEHFTLEKYISNFENDLVDTCESFQKGIISKLTLSFQEMLTKLTEAFGPTQLLGTTLQMHKHQKNMYLKHLLQIR